MLPCFPAGQALPLVTQHRQTSSRRAAGVDRIDHVVYEPPFGGIERVHRLVGVLGDELGAEGVLVGCRGQILTCG